MGKPSIYSGNLLIWLQISQWPYLQEVVGRINGVAAKSGFTVFLKVETKKMSFLKMFTESSLGKQNI